MPVTGSHRVYVEEIEFDMLGWLCGVREWPAYRRLDTVVRCGADFNDERNTDGFIEVNYVVDTVKQFDIARTVLAASMVHAVAS